MGFEDLLPPVFMEIRAKFADLHSELGKVSSELDEAANRGEVANTRMGKAFQATQAYGQTLTKGVIGLAGVVGGFAVDAASSAEVVDAKLRTAIVNAGGSMEDMEPKITKLDSSMRGMGFTNDQTNTSLATLTTALKDPEKAMGAMGVATDLARAKNIDLNTASLLVAKAMEGQTRPLKALGIDLPIAAGNALAVKNAQTALATAQQKVNDVLAKYPDAANAASKGHAQYQAATEAVQKAQTKLSDAQSAGGQILDELKSRVAGAGDAYGKTLRGQLDSAKAGVENMGESLGKLLIPAINDAIQVGVKIMDFLQGHTWILYLIATIFGVVMAAGVYKWGKSLFDTLEEMGSKLSEGLSKVSGWASSMIAKHTEVGTAAQVSADKQVVASEEVQAAETKTEGVISTKLSSIGSMLSTSAGKFADWAKNIMSRNTEVSASAETSAEAQVVAQETVQGAEEETAVVSRISGAAISTALGPISLAISAIITIVMLLQGHWHDVWEAIKAVAGVAWGILKGIFDGIVGAIKDVIGWIMDAVHWFENLFGAADNSTSASQRAIDTAAKVPGGITAANAVASNYSNLSYIVPSHDVGGWIRAARGKPQLGINHGGEYMLSLDMLQGRQPVDPKVLAALASQMNPSAEALTTGGSRPAATGAAGVTVIAQTNASPSQIASSVGWELRKRA